MVEFSRFTPRKLEEMIQFDGCIFFEMGGEKPPTRLAFETLPGQVNPHIDGVFAAAGGWLQEVHGQAVLITCHTK